MSKAEFIIVVILAIFAFMPAELWAINHFIYDFGYEGH
jgi:hypothetical protein